MDESNLNWSAYNPSIAKNPTGDVAVLVRSSNFFRQEDTNVVHLTTGNSTKNRLWFSEIVPETLELTNLREITVINPLDIPGTHGGEDGRLFWRDGAWHLTLVLHEPPTIRIPVMAMYRLDSENNTATHLYTMPSPYPNQTEKNWMASDVSSELFDFVYGPSTTIKNGQLSSHVNMAISGQTTYLSGLRGGSGLVRQEDGTYLAVMHDVSVTTSRFWDQKSFVNRKTDDRRYRHYLTRHNEQGVVIEISEPFVFQRHEIEFCAGLIERGPDLVLSWGSKDLFSAFGVIDKDKAVKLLKPLT